MLRGTLNGGSALSGAIQREMISIGGGDAPIKTISVDGVEIEPDNKKNVNIDLSGKADIGYVDTKVADLVNSAPETLDTLGEVAKAIQENESVVDALNSAIGSKADKSELNSYLPLTAGSDKKLTGDLYVQDGTSTKNIYIGSSGRIRGTDSGGIVISGNGNFIAFRPLGDSNANEGLQLRSTSFSPQYNKGNNLGTSDLQWKEIHGTTIYQNGEQVANKSELDGLDERVTTLETSGGGVSQEDFDSLQEQVNAHETNSPQYVFGSKNVVVGGVIPEGGSNNYQNVAVGNASTVSSSSGVAIGNNAQSKSNSAIAIGNAAKATGFMSIQLGSNTNSTAYTFQLWGDNIYNWNTHTLTVQNIELNGEDLNSKLSNISGGIPVIRLPIGG